MGKSSPGARQGALAAQLPIDPVELATLPAPERGAIYNELGVNAIQRASAEDAVRAVIRGEYRKAA